MRIHPLSERFPIGARIAPSEHGRESGIASRNGTVVGYGREEHLLRVQIDGKKTHSTYHVSFWQEETPPPREPAYRVPVDRFPPVPLPKP